MASWTELISGGGRKRVLLCLSHPTIVKVNRDGALAYLDNGRRRFNWILLLQGHVPWALL